LVVWFGCGERECSSQIGRFEVNFPLKQEGDDRTKQYPLTLQAHLADAGDSDGIPGRFNFTPTSEWKTTGFRPGREPAILLKRRHAKLILPNRTKISDFGPPAIAHGHRSLVYPPGNHGSRMKPRVVLNIRHEVENFLQRSLHQRCCYHPN
jgi:hypothetical protein